MKGRPASLVTRAKCKWGFVLGLRPIDQHPPSRAYLALSTGNYHKRGPAHLTALAGNEGGHKGREKRKKGKGKGRLSASPAYAGEEGGIGDDSGVLFRASRAVI